MSRLTATAPVTWPASSRSGRADMLTHAPSGLDGYVMYPTRRSTVSPASARINGHFSSSSAVDLSARSSAMPRDQSEYAAPPPDRDAPIIGSAAAFHVVARASASKTAIGSLMLVNTDSNSAACSRATL